MEIGFLKAYELVLITGFMTISVGTRTVISFEVYKEGDCQESIQILLVGFGVIDFFTRAVSKDQMKKILKLCMTLRDIDLENKVINIDRQLQRTSDMRLVIESAKTTAGTRKLPMTDDAASASG